MKCSWCRTAMDYVHGHAACVNGRCPMFGVNQAPCCDGETADLSKRPFRITTTADAMSSALSSVAREDDAPAPP